MFLMVILDYKSLFKERLKIAYEKSFMILFFLCMMTSNMNDVVFLAIFPATVCIFISILYGNVINKTFLLSPFSEKERARYYNTSLFIRVCLSMLIFMLSMAVAACFIELRFVTSVAMIFGMLFFAISNNIHSYILDRNIDDSRNSNKYNWKHSFLYGALQLLGIIVMYCMVFAINKKDAISDRVLIRLLTPLIIFILLAGVQIIKNHKKVRDIIINYEYFKQPKR